MKKMLIVGILLSSVVIYAAETPKAPVVKEQKNFLESVNLGVVGAVRHVNIANEDSHANLGAGLQLGLPVNKYVDLRVVALAYENNDWGDSVIDEVGFGGKVNLVKGLQEKLHLYGTGTGYRDFEADDWGFGVGLGAQYNITKNVYLGVGTEIRAWMDQKKDLLTLGSLNYKF